MITLAQIEEFIGTRPFRPFAIETTSGNYVIVQTPAHIKFPPPDADTRAAIYGQLAGSFYDVNAIPEKWLQKLSMRERITELADNLLALSESLPPAKEGGVVASG
jgi:hypothetical protein